MRIVMILMLLATVACRPIYGRDVANLTAFPEHLPAIGTSTSDLEVWFDNRGYAPGPSVFQSEGELRRQPGSPLVYALEADRLWWHTRVRTVQDYCVTQKFIYFQVDADGGLSQAIQNKRSVC